MRVLVVSGIWPPDVGGPASHAPAFAAYLHARGCAVEVVTTATAAPVEGPYPVHWVSRALPKGVVHVVGAAAIARRALRADVVYTTGMFARSGAGARAAGTPVVLKLTGDPAFERARWRGRVGNDIESFQRGGGGIEGAVLRRVRAWTLASAAHIVVPSEYLRRHVIGWGVPAALVTVVPNALPDVAAVQDRVALRRRLGIEGPTLAFAGRLGPQKALGVALAALAAAPGVSLLVAGDGEARAELEAGAAGLGGRVRFLGARQRHEVLELFAASDATLLSSSWENFPHTVVESLSVGVPVIATRVGGVPEIVADGVNGLLVPPGDAPALAAAIRRYFAEDELRERLTAAAAASVSRFAESVVFAQLEHVLAGVT
ncbi:MAG: glycosyltransferase family 4 protein [Gaiellaceae bacterium]